MKKTLFFLLLSTIGFTACNQDSQASIDLKAQALNEDQNVMRETAILVGRLLSNTDVKSEVLSKMKEVNDNGDIISFAYLLQDENNYKKNELIAVKSKNKLAKTTNLFKNALIKEFSKNKNDYQGIKSKVFTNNTENRLITDIVTDLSTSLTLEGLQIYYPYDPEYSNDDTSVTDFYVSYDPLNGALTNEAFKVIPTEFTDTVVRYGTPINNDFLDTNPVFVVIPIDPCDIPGSPCSFETLEPVASILPPPLIGGATLLTYNVNHNDIPEKDIISTIVPQIRINGTSWLGFAGSHQKLRIYRSSASIGDGGTLTQNTDGTISTTAFSYHIIDVRIARKFLKNSTWMSYNKEFDPDWNMSENTEVMTIFSLHNLSFKASTEVTVQSGLKLVKGEITATPEASGSSKVTISLGGAKFRANAELSRRQILSTIVGPGITNKTVLDKGIEYNVKKIGVMEYYFKHYYTDLTN